MMLVELSGAFLEQLETPFFIEVTEQINVRY
jgi:hypothetical protein